MVKIADNRFVQQACNFALILTTIRPWSLAFRTMLRAGYSVLEDAGARKMRLKFRIWFALRICTLTNIGHSQIWMWPSNRHDITWSQPCFRRRCNSMALAKWGRNFENDWQCDAVRRQPLVKVEPKNTKQSSQCCQQPAPFWKPMNKHGTCKMMLKICEKFTLRCDAREIHHRN